MPRLRYYQIRPYAWGLNLALLAGLTASAFAFRAAHAERLVVPAMEFPASAVLEIERTWPPDEEFFAPIWETYVNGEVPIKRPVPVPPPKPSPVEQFVAEHTVDTALLVGDDALRSVAYVRAGGRGHALRLGASIGKWQLIDLALEPEGGTLALSFRHRPTGEVARIERRPVRPHRSKIRRDGRGNVWFDDGHTPGEALPGTVPEDSISRSAFLDPSDPEGLTWIVPAPEARWWSRWGENGLPATSVENGRLVLGSTAASRGPARLAEAFPPEHVILSVGLRTEPTRADLLAGLAGEAAETGRTEIRIRSPGGLERTVVLRFPE